jgi:ribonucleotide reductase beta subunit family protein with ferritin-like domain
MQILLQCQNLWLVPDTREEEFLNINGPLLLIIASVIIESIFFYSGIVNYDISS